jgi:hypothetical protein
MGNHLPLNILMRKTTKNHPHTFSLSKTGGFGRICLFYGSKTAGKIENPQIGVNGQFRNSQPGWCDRAKTCEN